MTAPRKNLQAEINADTPADRAAFPDSAAAKAGQPRPGHAARDHEEALLDEAVDESFPASDPIADLPAAHLDCPSSPGDDAKEDLLDDAIAMTFPASDPVAIPNEAELSIEKDLRRRGPAFARTH